MVKRPKVVGILRGRFRLAGRVPESPPRPPGMLNRLGLARAVERAVEERPNEAGRLMGTDMCSLFICRDMCSLFICRGSSNAAITWREMG